MLVCIEHENIFKVGVFGKCMTTFQLLKNITGQQQCTSMKIRLDEVFSQSSRFWVFFGMMTLDYR